MRFEIASSRRHLVSLGLAIFAIAVTAGLDAKIAARTLAELVNGSDLILYGETTPHVLPPLESDYGIVWFKPLFVIKGSPSSGQADIPVCEQSQYVDTIDLHKYPGAYVVFANHTRRCYAPSAGYISLIPINEGIARTAAIDGEPETEPVRQFVKKIRKLMKAH